MTSIQISTQASQQIGPLDVWPLRWTGLSRVNYEVPPAISCLKFSEHDDGDGPRVEWIEVSNPTEESFIIPSGWIVGAELNQVRTFNYSEHIMPRETILASVSCVEKGRWGVGKNLIDGGRAPFTVNAAGWNFDWNQGLWKLDKESRQSRVWDQVHRQEERSGSRPTHSLEQVMREDSVQEYVPKVIQTVAEHTIKPLSGQNGVLVAFEGQPLVMELFSNSVALKKTIKQTLRSISFDVEHLEYLPTDRETIERFIREASLNILSHLSDTDWAILLAGGTSGVETRASMDLDERFLQITTFNRRHRLLSSV
jgi:hypothetical protein